jgi:hypothetical protein
MPHKHKRVKTEKDKGAQCVVMPVLIAEIMLNIPDSTSLHPISLNHYPPSKTPKATRTSLIPTREGKRPGMVLLRMTRRKHFYG